MNSTSKILSYVPAATALAALALFPFSFGLGVLALVAGGFLAIGAHDYRQMPSVARMEPAGSGRARLPLAA